MKVAAQKVRRNVWVMNLSAVLLLIVAAPTVGDIGSCGAAPEDLDPAAFFKQKAELDCLRCRECAFGTAACGRACDPAQTPTSFPEGCYPIAHDGEVCLRVLDTTTCDEYGAFMADQGAIIPTECNFCPVEGAP